MKNGVGRQDLQWGTLKDIEKRRARESSDGRFDKKLNQAMCLLSVNESRLSHKLTGTQSRDQF